MKMIFHFSGKSNHWARVIRFSLFLSVLTIQAVQGQVKPSAADSDDKKNDSNEIPEDIEKAILKVEDFYSGKKREYFKSLPENLAMAQFGEGLYMTYFKWRMGRRDSKLTQDFVKNGIDIDATPQIFSRLLIAALYRKLNGQEYSIAELKEKYSNLAYEALIKELREIQVGDTLFSNHFNAERTFHRFTWDGWFQVVSIDNAEKTFQVKILKLRYNEAIVDQIKTKSLTCKVGDVWTSKRTDLFNGTFRSWKEINKLLYPE